MIPPIYSHVIFIKNILQGKSYMNNIKTYNKKIDSLIMI